MLLSAVGEKKNYRDSEADWGLNKTKIEGWMKMDKIYDDHQQIRCVRLRWSRRWNQGY